ncbi:MAG: DUF5305 family protein [Candidatus Thermoplasmatota archaeon]
MNDTQTPQKTGSHRKKRYQVIFLLTLGILCILFLYALTQAYAAYETPETQRTTQTVLTYENTGWYDYTVSLKNNTIYENKTTLGPGEGTLFKQLIDHINASFSYTFRINQSATINSTYQVTAIIQTNLWTKTYTLIPRTSFNETGTTTSFTVSFPLQYAFYDAILSKINEETGVPAQNPILLIRSAVTVQATTQNNTVSSDFTPVINMTLNQKTLEISKELSFTQPGSVTKSTSITMPEVPVQRTQWTILSIVSLIGMCVVAFLTIRTIERQPRTQKELKKMKKKYGEWLVETKTHPDTTNARRIEISSLEDLAKVSEELGKPILMYASPLPLNHRFYVLDETTIYDYIFKPKQENHTTTTTDNHMTTEGITISQLKKKQKFHRLLFSDRKHQ